MIICAPVVSQMAVEGAVREDWTYPHTFHSEFIRRRAIVADRLARLPGVEWTPTGGGFFAFARVRGCTDSKALATRLLEEAHVVTIPGSSFGRAGEGCLRLSFGSVKADELDEAMERLERYL
jgi:aspartate/methionine/tyrosine aminotransferase